MNLFGFLNGGADLTPEAAASRIAADSRSVIIDVRSPEEFGEGHVKGALLLPVDRLDEKIDAAVADKNTPIFVYCHSGARAAAAVRRLKADGYTSVFNIGGVANRGFTKAFPLVR